MAGLSTELSYCCRPCLRRLATPSKPRSFTSTSSRRKHGGLPTFTPTSSPELDSILSKFRSNVFFPSHLLRPQRNLLYKPKNVPLLTSDEPATVRVGNEVLQMRPLNRLRDEPPTRPSLNKITKLMKNGQDWRNMPGFLEGLHKAKRTGHLWQVEKIIRIASVAGQQGMVLECLRRVEGTRVGLWDIQVAREVMWGAVLRAQQRNWEKDGVELAVKYARAVWDLMEDPRHIMKAPGGGPEHVIRARPEIVGVMVQLEAAEALLVGEGKDEGARLENLVEMLLGCYAEGDLDFAQMSWVDANRKLMMWAPVWHGMKLARKVLGGTSKYEKVLGEKMDHLESAFTEASNVMAQAKQEEDSRRGLKMYNNLCRAAL